MKIVHVVECAGGVDRYLQMLMPGLHEHNIKQTLVCSNAYEVSSFKTFTEHIVETDMRRTFNPLLVFKFVKEVRKIILEEKPDIVYCHSSFGGAYGRLACIGLKVNVIYNPHGWGFNMLSKKNIIFKIMERWLPPLTDRIICISEFERDTALENKIASKDKLELIPNGIDIEAVKKAAPKESASLQIPKDAFVVGMVGRVCETKAPDIFIQAAKQIKENIHNAYFIIVGNGELEKEFSRYAHENGIPLLITGWTDKPYSFVKMFDVAMLLSRWEGFGLAVVEYMAANKNVVATKVGGLANLIQDGVDGLYVGVNDPQQAADKVLWLYHHPQEALIMRSRALEKVSRLYDISRVVGQHVNMLENLTYDGKP